MKCFISFMFIICLASCNSVSTTNPASSTVDPIPEPTPVPTMPVPVTISIKTGSVGMGNTAFGVFPLDIKVNTTVIWVNDDTVNHDFSDIEGNNFWCRLKPGDTCSFLFQYPGTFDYEDLFYQAASMSGRIVVESN